MNKNGFTLVELIGVVILIGLIALIAIPSVDYIITKTKSNAYNRTLDTLKDGLRNWVTDNKELIYEDGEEIIVTLSDLKEQGYVEYEIKNPKTSTCLANTMQFKITRVKDTEKDTYEYTFLDDELLDGNLKDCEAVSKTPSIYLLGDNPQKIEITNDSTLTYALFDPGATAKSSAGEDISSSIVKSNNVNLKVLGKDYHAKYTIIENGISKTLTRKIYVVDTTSPELHVPEDLEIEIGETLNLMEGVTATDNSGVAPTIKTSGTINFNKEGEYKVIYIATDKSGNKTSKERVIKVFRPYYVMKSYPNGPMTTRVDFHEEKYSSKILTVNFIDWIDIPENAVVSWDLSEQKNGTIMGWLEESEDNPGYYDFYVGSYGKIRANPFSRFLFWGLSSVYKFNFDNFDTQGVSHMGYMFSDCPELTSLDLSGFDTSSVESMNSMFSGSSNLTELNLNSFDTSNVSDMRLMFWDVTSLISLDLSNFDTSNVEDMGRMFESIGQTDIDLSSFDTTSVTLMDDMFSFSDITDLDLSSFNTENVTTMTSMFRGANIESLDLSNFDTSSVTDMSWMFADMDYLKYLNISNFNTSAVTDMNNMFNRMPVLESLDVSSFDTTNVTNMSGMFKSLKKITTLDVTNLNTSNVTNMSEMFSYNNLTTLDLSNFDTSNVTNMRYMFSGTTGLKNLNISSFTNLEKVENMAYMFAETGLEEIDLSNKNMPALTNVSSMFENTVSLRSINLSNFNAPNITSLNSTFYLTPALKNLNLSNFNTSSLSSMVYTFRGTGLENLDLSSFDTSKVTSMYATFWQANHLKTVNLSSFNTSNVISMHRMFSNCSSLESLDLTSFDVSKVTDMVEMFLHTSSLEVIYVNKNWVTSENNKNMFLSSNISDVTIKTS